MKKKKSNIQALAEAMISPATKPEVVEVKPEPPAVVIEPQITAGIFCPSCRFPMRVYKTKRLTGAIARERICDRCGEKQDTEESVI